MGRETTSKNIDGITDLVVIAPIKEGFINAYENITYATRLRVVAEALNKVRVSAREHEFAVPFSDVSERILTLLDFRIGVLDKDLLELESREVRNKETGKENRTYSLEPRRYLYLTATFDTALEPYMRLIWDPLGPFLDLIFCNCEGYVTAGDHSCEEFLDWVRANQVDSAIFYATTGNTINDDIYHGKIDRLLRMPGERNRNLKILRTSLRSPEQEANDLRALAWQEALAGERDKLLKINEQALEVLTVLFRLVDFYPPEWLFDPEKKNRPSDRLKPPPLSEGKYLARVASSILQSWDFRGLSENAERAYREPLEWYRTAAIAAIEANPDAVAPNALGRQKQPDPDFVSSEVQGGILTPLGTDEAPVLHGSLLLFTVTDRAKAREFLATLPIHFEGDPVPQDGIFHSVSFTACGLRHLGLKREIWDELPKEYRDGMEARAGLIGDLRENHPRRWKLPQPERKGSKVSLPPVHLSEIDIVVQLRYAPPAGSDPQDRAPLDNYVKAMGDKAKPRGLALAAVETMGRLPTAGTGQNGKFTDHFGFADGLSQPDLAPQPDQPTADQWTNYSRLGEVLAGYGNDRMDYGWQLDPLTKGPRGKKKWNKNAARTLSFNGSYMVARKLRQEVEEFASAMKDAAAALREEGFTITADQVAAQLVGRRKDGTPLVPGAQGENGFDYKGDVHGSACPFAAHIRRANPRTIEHGRPSPRIMRRGMSYGPPLSVDPKAERGLMFMCYQSSISEQYEVIQRWINGGNSTGISSFQVDPLLGIGPKATKETYGKNEGEPRFFQFEWEGRVAQITLPKPFVAVEWGLYLLAPSRRGLALLTGKDADSKELEAKNPVDFEELHENAGREMTERMANLPAAIAEKEWKRLLEDIDAKDPYELSQTPDIWSAIRWYKGGAMRLQVNAEASPAASQQRAGEDIGHPFKDNQFLKSALSGPELANLKVILQKAMPEVSDIENFLAEEAVPEPDKPKGPLCPAGQQPAIIVASKRHVMHVLRDWKRYSVDEQLHRIERFSGAIYVTQQPDDQYRWYPELNPKYNYRKESLATNEILMGQSLEDGFSDGYEPSLRILAAARKAASDLGLDYFKMELRRQYLMPALGSVCSRWFGIPGPLSTNPLDDPHGLNEIMINAGWDWKTATSSDDPEGESLRVARCPGDCLAPSRGTFYPRPTPSISAYAADHGPAIRKAGEKFVSKFWGTGTPPPGKVASAMFEQMDDKSAIERNLIGIMVGAMPPMDGNLRGILVEWLLEKTLWRHQAAYMRLRAAGMEPFNAAYEALWQPITRAMCKRPAPDLIYRQANSDDTLKASGFGDAENVMVKEGDLVIVSLVGASQQSLMKEGNGDIDVVFGGYRQDAWQGDHPEAVAGEDKNQYKRTVHACPAQKMAMGAMLGILAALLEAGQIEALPGSLIVKIKDVPLPAPA